MPLAAEGPAGIADAFAYWRYQSRARSFACAISSPHFAPTVNVLSDSGEKCLVVLYYLGSLVEADKTAEVFYNQLVVNHTHEDVDGEFGRGACTSSQFAKPKVG